MKEQQNENFETIIKELEEIAQELENGELSLEQSVEKFERGMKLSAKCNEILETAEKRITMLVKESNGEMKEEAFGVEE